MTRFPDEFEISPFTYIIPDDYRNFDKDRENNPDGLWILKPAASSCGKGIKLITSSSKVDKK